MPRQARVAAAGVPHHITHRGDNRQDVFLTDEDRRRYQQLLALHLAPCQAALLGWCWLSNHVHLVVVPDREDSLARLVRRVHSSYAQDLTGGGETGICGEVVSIHALWGRDIWRLRCCMST